MDVGSSVTLDPFLDPLVSSDRNGATHPNLLAFDIVGEFRPDSLKLGEFCLGTSLSNTGSNGRADLLGPPTDFRVITGCSGLPQRDQCRLADGVKLLARRLALAEGIIPKLLDEAGDLFGLCLLARVASNRADLGCDNEADH